MENSILYFELMKWFVIAVGLGFIFTNVVITFAIIRGFKNDK